MSDIPGKLRVTILHTEVRDFVIFAVDKTEKTFTRITQGGVYEGHAFIVAGVLAHRNGDGYRTTFGSATKWLYSKEAYRYSVQIGEPKYVREAIQEAGFYTGGGGKDYAPGEYILFNGTLWSDKERLAEYAKYLSME